MASKDTDTAIAYQNKDIVSKLFGDRMKGKPLSLFGLRTDLKVVDVRPTNIPIVQAKELRMDNLFELEDGSVAVLDYESEYKKANFSKYGRYILDVFDRYLKEGKEPDIRMMVVYTADIEKVDTTFTRTACRIQVEVAYLAGVPSEEWQKEIENSIHGNMVTDEILMHLVLLPLTYKGEARKQKAIRDCVDLACRIPDKDQETFVLAGILTFTDKVINEETRQHIKEVLGMTQVGKMLMDEGRAEGREEGREEGSREEKKKMAQRMLEAGKLSVKEIAEYAGLNIEMVEELTAQ